MLVTPTLTPTLSSRVPSTLVPRQEPAELQPWRNLDRSIRAEFPGDRFLGLAVIPGLRQLFDADRFVFCPAHALQFVVAASFEDSPQSPATVAAGYGPAILRHGMPVIDPQRWFDLALRPGSVSDRQDVRYRRSLRLYHLRRLDAACSFNPQTAYAAEHLFESLDFHEHPRQAKAAIAAAEALYAAYAVTQGSPQAAKSWHRFRIGGNPVNGGLVRPVLPRPYVRLAGMISDPAQAVAFYQLLKKPGVSGEILNATLIESFLDDFIAGLPVYAPATGRVYRRPGGFAFRSKGGKETTYQGAMTVLPGSPVRPGSKLGYLGPDMRRLQQLRGRLRYGHAMAEARAWAGGESFLEACIAAWLWRQIVDTPEGSLIPAELIATVPLAQSRPEALYWELNSVEQYWVEDFSGYLLPALEKFGPQPDRVALREVEIRFTPPWRM